MDIAVKIFFLFYSGTHLNIQVIHKCKSCF